MVGLEDTWKKYVSTALCLRAEPCLTWWEWIHSPNLANPQCLHWWFWLMAGRALSERWDFVLAKPRPWLWGSMLTVKEKVVWKVIPSTKSLILELVKHDCGIWSFDDWGWWISKLTYVFYADSFEWFEVQKKRVVIRLLLHQPFMW